MALQLFAERGFESVTTAQIAAAAGISPRSFFRYFPTKDDVVLSGISDAGLRVQAALEARPPEESPWNALRHALRVLIDQPAYPREYLPMIAQISREAPLIRAREIEKHQQWEDLLAGAALSCLNVTTGLWVDGGDAADPAAILDDLMGAVSAS